MTDLLDEALAAHLGRSLYDSINKHLADGQRAEQERDGAYRERAHLVAHLAALHPAHIGYTDPNAIDWLVVTIETPAGQMSWHIAERDRDLFEHVRLVPSTHNVWDGHTTEQKYERLRRLTTDARSAEAFVAFVADTIADHEGDEWADHSATTAIRAAITRHATGQHPGPEETDTTPAEPAPAGLDEHIHDTIEHEIYAYRERTMLWPETGGVTQEIARLATRGALKALSAPAATEATDTVHRHCILCGGQVQPGHTCDPNTVMQRLVETRERADQLAATLREVLNTFTTARRDDGVIAGHYLEGNIHPDDMTRWRAVLNQTQEQ